MRALATFFMGIATGAAAILLHLAYPPFGLVLAMIGTFTAIWSIGRYFGRYRYKFLAGAGWLAIFWQGANYGVGNEILIQGDNLGTAFIGLGALAIFLAIALPN